MKNFKTITEAREAWKLLNGVFCVYKPQNIPTLRTREILLYALTRDLNNMDVRPPKQYVSIEGSLSDENSRLTVVSKPSFADHPLVIGPRYQEQDFRMNFVNNLGRYMSGLLITGIGDGCKVAYRMKNNNLLRKFEIDGQFGLATENYFVDGPIIGKSTFKHVTQSKIDLILSSIQAAYQANAFKFSGVPLDSQEAYEIASAGIVRPADKTLPMIYKLSCIKFEPPYFTIEAHVINESEDYLSQLIHEIGLRLKSNAVCVKIRSTAYGLFNLDHALLRKHWNLENILQNINDCRNAAAFENTIARSPLIKTSRNEN